MKRKYDSIDNVASHEIYRKKICLSHNKLSKTALSNEKHERLNSVKAKSIINKTEIKSEMLKRIIKSELNSESKKLRKTNSLLENQDMKSDMTNENLSSLAGKTDISCNSSVNHSAANYSSNWKNLQQQIKAGEKKRNKKTKVLKETVVTEKVISPSTNKLEIWFDDVDEFLLDPSCIRKESSSDVKTPVHSGMDSHASSDDVLVKAKSSKELTNTIAIDCEMVGVGDDSIDSILARVSVVNLFGHCLYDAFVRPTEPVTDYRTKYSGVREGDLRKGEDFKKVQKDLADLLKNRILVGHALHNDLKVLFLDHPRKMIRDTSRYRPFRQLTKGGTPSLKFLTKELLGVDVQQSEHDSIQDAQAAMRLYTMHKKKWEAELRKKRGRVAKVIKKKKVRKSDDILETMISCFE